MNPDYPRIRYYVADELLLFREGLSINFYFLQSHEEIAPMIIKALDVYLQAVGSEAIGRYIDDDGNCPRIKPDIWTRIRQEYLDPSQSLIRLRDAEDCQSRYSFDYHGHEAYDVGGHRPRGGAAVSFWLPTEYMDEHGPGRVRELAMEIASLLPFCSGHAGLSFNGETDPLSRSEAHELCFRYPGMDCADVSILSWRMGPRTRGAYWLTFLGQPLLRELGGAAALRSRLTSPETRVQEMDSERVVISLGRTPEAGDLEQGRTLPAYRELARVLEPWLYHDDIASQSRPEVLRWERRFLD